MTETMDYTKTIDELHLQTRMHQLFPKQKKAREETEHDYERKFMKGY